MKPMAAEFSTLIIGCGAIAGGYDAVDIAGPNILTHAKAFRSHPGFDLVGCVDRDPVRAQNFAAVWQVEQAYPTLDAALESRNFDVISLCAPTPDHENILRRVEPYNPRLVFCEKPLTDRIASARAMAALYRDRMAVNYLRRFDPELRRLARAIAAGKYGRLSSATARYNKGLYNNGS
ncbi:MAG: Gfo/Idh/MocA family oxidoreductase, partial [Alphaproteobacteria bacterium]|nr:Gfo/Idh/MocA family oxidoreductase [Alphaproteobacteria bacterium]